MKIIRNGVFETNSSSTHSITLGKNDELLDTLYPYPDGTLVFDGITCYQGFESADTLEKCNYYVTGLLTEYDHYGARDYIEVFKKVVSEHTGASRIIIDFDVVSKMVIDFKEGTGSDITKYSEEDLKNFLFNKQSSVEIRDRDEDYYRRGY